MKYITAEQGGKYIVKSARKDRNGRVIYYAGTRNKEPFLVVDYCAAREMTKKTAEKICEALNA